METTPEADRLLQLQLRAGELEKPEGLLRRIFDEYGEHCIEFLAKGLARTKHATIGPPKFEIHFERGDDEDPTGFYVTVVAGQDRSTVRVEWPEV